MARRSGLFLSFEGGEGSGKSVQVRRLATALEGRGIPVVIAPEPGGTPAGERIREILLHARDADISAETQALLFSAARAQLVRDVIRPALARGDVVIADRYFDSTLVYQGAAGGADIGALREITRFAVGSTIPKRTFLLDVPVDVILARRARESDRPWDRFEARDRDFHEKLREGFLQLAAQEPGRFVVLRGDRDEDVISREILTVVDDLLAAAAR
ncbi:MAG TPA: dTMP kinase [Gaiellaceae bacterium]|nr:dTMP kinase [Gaiellaceae bacterium]